MLARALHALNEDPGRVASLGVNGHARVIARFSVDAMVAGYETLYRRRA
jgi:hypothetical protein